nr:cytochrome P450 82C4-like [Tanacetum cinerariifolium]
MEPYTQLALPILGLLLSFLIYSYTRNIRNKSSKSIKLLAPEPSGALPLIGHLHHLRGEAPLARILAKLADDYGPAYSLKLGSHRALVVSSWQLVKECFTTNDRNFATRPNMAVNRYMGYDSAVFALAPYGQYWREIRKLVTLELLTSQRLEKLKNVRNSEVNYLIHELYLLSQKNGAQTSIIDMTKWFEHITFNIIVRMLAGKRFSNGCSDEGNNEDLQVKEAIKKGLYLSGVFVVSDVLPNLEWMDIGGHVKAMKQAAKELDMVLGKWVDEHVEKRKEYASDDKEADFIDQAAKELDMVLGKWVDEHVEKRKEYASDDKEADFIDVMLSTLSKDAEIFGFTRETIIKATTLILILTGARLIVNVWKLHRDPQVWSDPHEFRPERFLEEHSNVNYQGQNFEYIPFSSGRRMCPASSFALQVMHLTLARLLQGFDLSTPMGMPVDMTEGLGIALPKYTYKLSFQLNIDELIDLPKDEVSVIVATVILIQEEEGLLDYGSRLGRIRYEY